MGISKYNTSYDTEKICEMIKNEKELFENFQKSIISKDDFIYIAENDHTVVGILIIQRSNQFSARMTLFVDQYNRNKGIGSELLQVADQIIHDSPYIFMECAFKMDENIAVFLEKRGFIRNYTLINMERNNTLLSSEATTDEALAKRGIIIRNYRDEDYWANHNIVSVGFYLMRKKACTIQWYDQPSECARELLARDYSCTCRYVLIDHDETIGIGKIQDNKIMLLGIRPDKQHQGYGTLMLSYLINKIIREQQTDKVSIGVLEKNPAKKLYFKLGFHDVSYDYNYIKFYKPDNRPKNPIGYASEKEIMEAFLLYGRLQEKMVL